MKKLSCLLIVCSFMLNAAAIRAQDVPFAKTADEIMKALGGKTGSQWIDGKEYVIEDGKVYQIINGVKARVRGLSQIQRMTLEPRVAVPLEFDFNTATLTGTSQPLMNEIGRALTDPGMAGQRFRIEGHTDAVGSDEANMTLSKERSEAIRNILITQYRIPETHLETAWFGKGKPIAGNDTDEGRQKNRRVEIVRILN